MAPKKSLLPPNSTFPEPPFHRVEDTGGKLNCRKIFEYWKSLDEKLGARIELCQVKIYRHWPIISVKLVEPTRTDSFIEKFTGSCPFDPADYIQWFLDRYGSGRWHVVMNEDNVHGEIMEAYFSAVDLDKYPPKLDLRTVVHGTKDNQSYVRWLAANGVKTPWDNSETSEENEQMGSAAGEALKVVASAVTEMAQKNVELAESAADARVEAAEALTQNQKENPAEARIPVSAAIEGMKMVSNAADQTIKMVTSHAGSQFNPIEMMRAAAEIVRPAGGDGTLEKVLGALTAANDRVLNLQQSQLDFYRSMVMVKNPDGTWAPAPAVQAPAPAANGGATGLRAMLAEGKELVELAEMLGFKRGRGVSVAESAGPPPEPGKPMMQTIVENIVPITTGLALFANLIYNLMRKGEPQNPQDAVANAQRQAAAMGATAPGFQPDANGGAPGFVPNPTPDPSPAHAMNDPLAAWRQFVVEIEGPFVSHFFGDGYNGYTFAEFILSNGSGAGTNTVGRKTYDTIKEQLGFAGFDQLIQSHFPLWSKLQGTPQKYKQFITEFFTYDEWQAEEAGKPEGGAVPTAAAPAAA